MTDSRGISAPDHRLPDDIRLGPVRLQVADAERSATFYREALGLQEERLAEGGLALSAGPGASPLIHLHERPGATPVPARGRIGLYHFAILLPDRASLGRLMLHLRSLGVTAHPTDHGVSEALYLRDPDGLGIEVYADRAESSWTYQDREVTMVSEPVRRADLSTAAGEGLWTGMPEGAVMGHVHFHVGDLAEAAGFYHEALGFDKTNWSYSGALFLSAGGYHHHVGLNTWARGGPVAEGDARLLEWELVLPAADDVEAAAASLVRSGGEVARSGDGVARGGAGTVPDGDGFTVDDPWGIRVRVRAG